MRAVADRAGEHGILAPVARLDRWLHAVLIALIVTCAIRYATRHGLAGTGVLILAGAAGLVAVYSARTLLRGRIWWPTVWVAGVTFLWVALTLTAPSFAWTAVPLAFAALQVLAFRYAVVVVVSGPWQSSTGTLAEIDEAERTEKPVFFSVEHLAEHLDLWRKGAAVLAEAQG